VIARTAGWPNPRFLQRIETARQSLQQGEDLRLEISRSSLVESSFL
jgi:hypothetical protein